MNKIRFRKREQLFYVGLENGMFVSQGEEGDILADPAINPPKLFREKSVGKKAIQDLLTNKSQIIVINSIFANTNITPRRFWANK